MVGERGFEPPTPWSRTRCSTRLSHSPTLNFHLQTRDVQRTASRSARLKKVSGLPAAPCGAASNARRPTLPPRHSQLLIDSIAVAHFSLVAPAGTVPCPPGRPYPGSHPPCDHRPLRRPSTNHDHLRRIRLQIELNHRMPATPRGIEQRHRARLRIPRLHYAPFRHQRHRVSARLRALVEEEV